VIVAAKFLPGKLHSLYVQESGVGTFGKVGAGVGHFTSDTATRFITPKSYYLHCWHTKLCWTQPTMMK